MKARYQISGAAIDLIKRFEGYRRVAARTPGGHWTIGYGHTRSAREGAQVSESDAEALLIYDLTPVARALNDWTFTPLTQNEFDALASFAFNIGLDAFRLSTVLRRLNEGAHLQAACEMELWRRAEVEGDQPVIDALVRRRSAEKALFLTPEGPWAPAPSSVLRPRLDLALEASVETPEAVETSMEGEVVHLRRERPPERTTASGPQTIASAALAVTARLATIMREPEPVEAEEAQPAPANDPDRAPASSRAELARAEALTLKALAPLAALATLGVALLAGGIYWAIGFAPEAGLSVSGAWTVGWLAGVAGIGMFSLAAYRLFERLGHGDETLID